MSNTIFFIGSYTEMLSPTLGGHGDGIYTIELNDETGTLKILHTEFITNPGYLVRNNDRLYSVVEVLQEKAPKVVSYKIKDDSSLQKINEQPVKGSLPCHINYTHNSLLVTCYGTLKSSGNILQFPISENGSIEKSTANFIHEGKSINQERQECPHAHQVYVHPNGKNVFVPDLGIDTLKAYSMNSGKLIETPQNDILAPKGGGPRHIVFNKSGNIGYLMNELTSEISIIKKENESFSLLKNVKSLPNYFEDTPSASAIRIHPNGAYLYAANRTLEAISIFKIDKEDLTLLTYEFLLGETIREFNITPNGKWLMACMQDSSDVFVYKILDNGTLEEVFHTHEITSPVCVCF